MGNQTFGLRMAKASTKDIEAAMELASIMDALDRGFYPTANNEETETDPTFFAERDRDHLLHLFNLLNANAARGGLFRVVLGLDTILRNNILDPDDDCLAIHPRFAQREAELTATIDVLRGALVGIVGERDADQLRGMEAYLRAAPAPDADKAATINAIHALLATMPAPEVSHD